TTGMKWVAGFDLSRRQTSKPSMSGIMMSSRMMSHSARAAIASASAPFDAVITSKYSADSRASSSFTLAGTSSTTRIRAVTEMNSLPHKSTHGLNELADRNRLGQIGRAAAPADAFLVALHGKGGDGNNRNGAQLRIVLDPARDLQARNLRQLDVHQDQIGPHLADEIERLVAIAGARGLIAVRFQQIAKELHVELVVLHDQDGLCHPVPPVPRKTKSCPNCPKEPRRTAPKPQFKLAPDSF